MTSVDVWEPDSVSHIACSNIMMDHLAVQCKKKLETFRIKELKDVLSRIGAGKQGRKQVLVDKIMAILLSAEMGTSTGLKLESLSARNSRTRDDVATIVDDVYRMRCCGAPDLATNMIDNGVRDGLFCSSRQSLPDSMLSATESRIRCPCGSTMEFSSMIQCGSPGCLVSQHVHCVIVPEKEEMKPEIPKKFFCELCRIQYGDPFCVSVTHPLMPIKTISSIVYSPEGGANLMQNLEASFMLTHNDWELLQDGDYDLQIWCALLNDEVAFRMHWPLKADLRVNGDFVRVCTNRPGQQKLGVSGRDDGPVITNYTREGLNRISFAAQDGRSFCLGVRILQRLTVDQVLRQIPSEAEGESFDVALARVQRCIGGGGAVDDDSDSDLEVVSEWVTVNLRCPMSGSRIKVAGRFKPCMHMGCFDLHTFVQLNERARKWQCPSCLKNYSLKDLVIDPFFTQVARVLDGYDEDVSEVEMKPDGCWRPKVDSDAKYNEMWRSPVGLITTANGVNNSHLVLKPVKEEESGSVEQAPSMKWFERRQDRLWQVSGTPPAPLTMSDILIGPNYEVVKNGAWSRSSATASKDVSSVNQEPLKLSEQFGREDMEVNSCPFSVPVNAYLNGFVGGVPDLGATPEIVVVSDEEDNSLHFNTGAEGRGSLYTNSVEGHENDGGCPLDLQGSFLQDYSEAGNSVAEVGSIQPNITDFLGVGQGPSLYPARTGILSLDYLSPALEASVGQSSHLHDCLDMQVYTPCVPLNQNLRDTNMLEMACTNPSRDTSSTCIQGNQILCNENPKELAASEPSFREFLPHQPARSAANEGGPKPREAFTDDMQNGWFSLSLGGSESLNAAAPPCELSDQRSQFDPLVESASAHDLSHFNIRIPESSFGWKGSAITSPDQYQRGYLCIDSDSG